MSPTLFAERLKAARKKRGITQREACYLGLIPFNSFKDWEGGKELPSLENLRKICCVLQCSADYLLCLRIAS